MNECLEEDHKKTHGSKKNNKPIQDIKVELNKARITVEKL